MMWIWRNAERTLIRTLADSKTNTNKVLVSSECGALTSALTPSLESKNRTSAIQWDKARERINDTTACEQHFFSALARLHDWRIIWELSPQKRDTSQLNSFILNEYYRVLIRVHTHDEKKNYEKNMEIQNIVAMKTDLRFGRSDFFLSFFCSIFRDHKMKAW